jgi:hypothetical protein
MDYANPSLGDYSLAVVRYPARTQPPVGTMYFNIGGPGASICKWSFLNFLNLHFLRFYSQWTPVIRLSSILADPDR